MQIKFLHQGFLALGLMACGAVVASPANGMFATGGSGSASDSATHGAASQDHPSRNPGDAASRGNPASPRVPVAPVVGDLPDDGTHGEAGSRPARPDLGWPALLPGSIW